MGKLARKAALAAAQAGAEAPQGFVPEPSMQEVNISQPRLGVSGAAAGGNQELWLLQLPLDFPADANAEWSITDDPVDGFRGRCQIQGVEYLLVPDQEALATDIYATPADPRGSLTRVVRRLTVVRSTVAPLLCFGQNEAEAKEAGMVAPGAPGNAAKRRRGDSGAAAAAAVQQATAAAAAAAGGQQQETGGSEKKKKDKKEKKEKGERSEKKKRKADAAAGADTPAAAAAAAGGDGGKSTEKKKDKKEKKKKKEKE